MFRRLLVPLDGSRFAEVALPVGLRLARSARAGLEVVMVHRPAAPVVPMGDLPLPAPSLDEELRQRELAYLQEAATRLGPLCAGAATWKLLDGAPGPALSEYIATAGPDLVVMATHGRGAIGRLWLGSVADHLIRHVAVPVLLLRPRDNDLGFAAEGAVHSILVPLDLSEVSARALEPAGALAALTQAHLTLLHVLEPFYGLAEPGLPYPVTLDPALTELQREEAQRHLDRLADGLRARGLRVGTRVQIHSGAAAAILTILEEEPFDVVAMSTHGATGFRRLLLGSVADKVIRGAEKPVLVVRAGGGRREDAKT